MARTARTDSPLNDVTTVATLDRIMSDMAGTGDTGTFVTVKADGSVSRHRGTVLERMATARGVRFRIQHTDGYAIVDPAYLVTSESAFVTY